MNDLWLKKSGILKKYATEADGRVTKDFERWAPCKGTCISKAEPLLNNTSDECT